MFNSNSRAITEQCGYTLKNRESVQICNYNLKNFSTRDCSMKNVIDFATSQPNVNYNGSHQTGMNGCNIKQNTELLLGSLQTHPKCRLNLEPRPFKTVPYLGKGPSNCELETKMLHGNQDSHKKSVECSSEKTYIPYIHYPLIDPIKQSVTNPKHLIEETNSNDWIRGGMSTRDMTRQKNFTQQYNKNQY